MSGPASLGVWRREGGGGCTTCTNEDSSAGKPRALGVRDGMADGYGREGRRGGGGGVGEASGSGKVHGPQGVVVNLNSFGQCLGVPAVALTGHMAALGTETRSHKLR